MPLGERCGEPEIMGSSRYFALFMCKTGLFLPKGRKLEKGWTYSTHGHFYNKDRYFNIMVLTHQTSDEHNDIIAVDIITIQNDLTKCPAIINMAGHLYPDRIKMT